MNALKNEPNEHFAERTNEPNDFFATFPLNAAFNETNNFISSDQKLT